MSPISRPVTRKSHKTNFIFFSTNVPILVLGFLLMTLLVSLRIPPVSDNPLFPDGTRPRRYLQGKVSNSGSGDNNSIANKEKQRQQQGVVTVQEEPIASWDNFDRIVCLNVKERPDRLEYAKQEFRRIGILDRIQFRIANKKKGGCFDAHWRAIKDAYDDEVDNLLIFEDDIYFGPGWQNVINDSNDFVKEEPDWEFLSFGYIELYVEASQTSDVIFNGKATSAHAVVLSRQGMKRFLEKIPAPVGYNKGMESDIVYLVHMAKSFVHPDGYKTIPQLREELGTDNLWDFVTRIDGFDERYKTLFQNTFVPAVQDLYGTLEMFFSYLPYSMRPWLIPNNVSNEDGEEVYIQIYRNGKEEEFPFRVGFWAFAFLAGLGQVTALTMPMPDYASRWRFMWFLFQFRK